MVSSLRKKRRKEIDMRYHKNDNYEKRLTDYIVEFLLECWNYIKWDYIKYNQ